MNVPHRFDNDNGAALIYFARFSGLKPQHNPAALGIIAAQSPQRIASHIRRLHCLGDSSGWTRGLMMASVMGVLMGREIIRQENI